MVENNGRYLNTESGVKSLLHQQGSCHFTGKSNEDWHQWRKKFRSHLVRLLGPTPPSVPLDVEVLERKQMDGYLREKVIFNSDPFSSVPAYVLIPDTASSSNRCPAVLCAHGHGVGKDGVVGLVEDVLGDYQNEYAVELARQGFVAMAPDWRGFGERKDREQWVNISKRDRCDLAYMTLGYFGYHLLRLDICDGQRCLDYLQARPDVDERRLGCMGCSFGGTMTTYLSSLDRRIKVAVISCYLSTLMDALGERNVANCCGSQFLFGLYQYGDISDVAGLIAPRPCLVQTGREDACFIEPDAKMAYAHLEKIYAASGKPDRLEMDLFSGGHEVNVEPAVAFLKQYLV